MNMFVLNQSSSLITMIRNTLLAPPALDTKLLSTRLQLGFGSCPMVSTMPVLTTARHTSVCCGR